MVPLMDTNGEIKSKIKNNYYYGNDDNDLGVEAKRSTNITNNKQHNSNEIDSNHSKRIITRFMVRYYPPGFIIEYDETNCDDFGQTQVNRSSHCIDLQNIENQDPIHIVRTLQNQESLLSNLNSKVILKLVKDLQIKLQQRQNDQFTLISSTQKQNLPIVAIDITKDSQYFVTCDSTAIKLWNSQNCALINISHPFISNSYSTSFTALKIFQSNNDYVLSGNAGGQLEIRDFEKMQLLSHLKLNSGPIKDIVINSFSSFAIAFGTSGHTIDIFDLPNCEHLGTLSAKSAQSSSLSSNNNNNCSINTTTTPTTIKNVKFDGSGMLLNALYDDGSLYVWDLGMQKLYGSYRPKSDQNHITCFDIAWDGSFLAAANRKGHIIAYSPDFKYQDCLSIHHNGHVDDVCISSNVYAIASQSLGQSYFLMHNVSERKTSRIMTQFPISQIGFSAKGDKLFVNDLNDGICSLYKTTGILHQTLQIESKSSIKFTKFSYNSDSLLIGDSSNLCHVYGA